MILAIDSTTKKASAALMIDADNIKVKSISNEITHSEKLLPLVDELLKENNVSLKDIGKLATTLGPGSFTGVRIGIATVKALAKVLNADIIGATSLKLLALEKLNNVSDKKYVLATMDAKNNRIYYELFEVISGPNGATLKETAIQGNLPYELVISLLKGQNVDSMLVVSDNTEMLLNPFTEAFSSVSVVSSELKLENIFKNIESHGVYNYDNIDAMYFRSSEAERTKNGEI